MNKITNAALDADMDEEAALLYKAGVACSMAAARQIARGRMTIALSEAARIWKGWERKSLKQGEHHEH